MASAPPNYYPPAFDEMKRREYDRVVNRLDIQEFYLAELRQALCGTKKVIVVDNSASMARAMKNTHLNKAQFGGVVRRVDELIEFLKTAIPLLALDAPQGIDFWFLNELDGTPGPVFVPGIHAFEQVAGRLAAEPNGRTPLCATLTAMQRHYAEALNEQGLHCIITTDGAPSEGNETLYNLIFHRPSPKKFIINFLVCTDDDSEVEYLDLLDRKAESVDVTDDFDTERKQVMATKKLKKFTYDDYICKAIIGAASPRIDQMDESKSCVIL